VSAIYISFFCLCAKKEEYRRLLASVITTLYYHHLAYHERLEIAPLQAFDLLRQMKKQLGI